MFARRVFCIQFCNTIQHSFSEIIYWTLWTNQGRKSSSYRDTTSPNLKADFSSKDGLFVSRHETIISKHETIISNREIIVSCFEMKKPFLLPRFSFLFAFIISPDHYGFSPNNFVDYFCTKLTKHAIIPLFRTTFAKKENLYGYDYS